MEWALQRRGPQPAPITTPEEITFQEFGSTVRRGFETIGMTMTMMMMVMTMMMMTMMITTMTKSLITLFMMDFVIVFVAPLPPSISPDPFP